MIPLNTHQLIELCRQHGYLLIAEPTCKPFYYDLELKPFKEDYKPLSKEILQVLKSRYRDLAFHLTGCTGLEFPKPIKLILQFSKPIDYLNQPNSSKLELNYKQLDLFGGFL